MLEEIFCFQFTSHPPTLKFNNIKQIKYNADLALHYSQTTPEMFTGRGESSIKITFCLLPSRAGLKD